MTDNIESQQGITPPQVVVQEQEIIYESGESEPDDDLWLEYGKKMVIESLTSVRNAANSMLSALGVLQGIYLGILGFSEFISKELPLLTKALFIIPAVPWMFALFLCLKVTMTELAQINIFSPGDIREEATRSLEEKQRQLQTAFALMIAGLLVAFALILFRLKL
jgi:hypothetical protein